VNGLKLVMDQEAIDQFLIRMALPLAA
jgi:hypothetical protein